MSKFKKAIIFLIIVSVVFLPSCGNDRLPEAVVYDNTELTEKPEVITIDEAKEESSWKELYYNYLKLLDSENDDSTYNFEFDKSEYAFVELPDHESPVMILFDGWRVFAFFEIVDGEVNPVKNSDGDRLITSWVDFPMYLYAGDLYIFGYNGAPSLLTLDKITITDEKSSIEQIVSARASTPEMGVPENAFWGRNKEEITKDEFNRIVEPIKDEGKKIGFIDVNTVTDYNVSEAIEAFTDFMQSGESEEYFTYVDRDDTGYLILTPEEYEIPLMIVSDGMGLFRLFVYDCGEVMPAVSEDGKEIVLPGNAGVYRKDNEICFYNSGGLPVNEIVNVVSYEETAFTVKPAASKSPNEKWYENNLFNYKVEEEDVSEEDYNNFIESLTSFSRIMDGSGFIYH